MVVGDEVLDGFVPEGNAAWLAPRLREAGIDLRRILVVPDEVHVIAKELRGLLAFRPSLIITTGGVGGTWDDVTYEAVAAATDRGLQVSEELRRPVQGVIDWYAQEGYELDRDAVEGMLRIATVPAGAVTCKLGTWLACVQLDLDGGFEADDGATVVMLPGPPGHVQALVEGVLLPRILGGRRTALAVREVAHPYPENVLVGTLARIRRRHPLAKAGSYPGDPMIVRFKGPSAEVEMAARELEAFIAELHDDPRTGFIRDSWKNNQAARWEVTET